MDISMNNIKAILICTFLLLFISESNASISEPLDPQIAREIERRIESGIMVGIVIGIVDEAGEHYYSFGRTSLDSNDKPDKNTIFDIGSISKTFATTILADMVARDEISYDKPIRSYLPSEVHIPRRGEKEITPWHLATHSSGLPMQPTAVFPSDIWDTYGDYSRTDFYNELSQTKLSFDVGSRSEYSSFGLWLLGDVLTIKTGRTFEELLTERVTEVLSMPNTTSVLTPKIRENLAEGHSYLIPTYSHVNTVFPAGGSMKSSAKDMLRYLSANMGIVDSPLNEVMKSTHTVQFQKGVANFGQALGWWVASSGTSDVMVHTGKTHGYHSMTGFIPAEKRGVVVLTNSNGFIDDLGLRLLIPEWNLWDSKPPLSVALYKAIQEGGYKEALAKFQGLSKDEIESYYTNENGLNDTGLHYIRKGEYKTGLAVLQYTATLFPASANVYDSLGRAYTEAADKKSAIKNYQKALKIDPLLSSAVIGLSRLQNNNRVGH
jgi:D-alanyl-D-alanine-carboxypeptidase/D-alanyl-D-alanine-endopeptidase